MIFSEAGEIPALCLSNRDIYERIGETVIVTDHVKADHWGRKLREGVQVGSRMNIHSDD